MLLIIDGDAESAARTERVLKYHGLDALAVRDGMEALALIDMQPPTLILLDLEIAGMDGMALLKAVRADPKFKKTPILIYTAIFEDQKRREAERAGAQEYIVKGTIGLEALLGRVRRHLPGKNKPPL